MMRSLVRECDVFSQSYRPGALAGRGLSPEALAELRPGIVYVTLSAWGHEGPWRGRRGYDTVVQSANGIASGPGNEKPEFLPYVGAGLRRGLPARVRHDGRARPSRARGRQLARARFARRRRSLDPPATV